MRVLQISDTHLSCAHGYFDRNTQAVSRWLETQDADLIIHTGDLTMDGVRAFEDLALAARWRAGLRMKMLCVPGNHDVGDHVSIRPDQVIDDARLAAWRETIGPDYWRDDRDGWRLIGLNAMVMGTGHAVEQRQLDWLREALSTQLPVALFLHKPLFIEAPHEGPRGYWTVKPEPRRSLLELIDSTPVKLIASGHLHNYRARVHAGVAHVWGPASSFVVGDSQEDLGGERRLGIVEHVFSSDGVASRFIRPEGLEDLPIEPVQRLIYPPLETAR